MGNLSDGFKFGSGFKAIKKLATGEQSNPNDLIAAQAKANQINQYAPFGSTVYGIDGSGRTTATYTPSQAFSGLTSSLGNYVQNNLNNSLSLDTIRRNLNSGGASASGLRANLSALGNPSDLMANLSGFGRINLDGMPDLNIDFSGEAKKAQDATYQSGYNLMRPQLELQQRRAEQRLADQGIPITGEASIGDNGVLTALNRDQGQQLNNLSLASVLAGNDRQNQLYNQALQGRGQLFGEQSTMADLLDRQRQQQYGENQGVFNAQAQNRQQLFGENQAVADFLLRKQMSLAGLSNQNAAMAQGLLQPQQFGVEGVNAAGIINDVNASKNAMLSGLTQSGASLAAAAIASDSRLKDNILRVGEYNGFPLYEFNYKGEKERFRGVMAQDVEMIRPEAVVEMDGYKAVRYDMINVPFERIA